MPPELAAGTKGGYLFTLEASPEGYIIRARPEIFKTTGRRTFYSDQTFAIRQNWSAEPATQQSPAI